MTDLTRNAFITIYRMLNDRDRRVFTIFFAMEVSRTMKNKRKRRVLFSIRIFRSKRLIVDKINKTNQIFQQANENLSFHRIGRSRCYKNEAPKFPMNIDFGRIKSHSIG